MTMVETDCTFTYEGRKFTCGGAVVTPDRIVAYPGKPDRGLFTSTPGGPLNDWHGREIGRYRIVSSWRVNSYVGSHMNQIEATVDGVTYTGRGFGEGMIYQGKRKRTR